MARYLPTLLLALALFGSALGRVGVAHWERSLNASLQQLHAARDRIDSEWSRLLIEEATLGDLNRVEQVARRDLDMIGLADSHSLVVSR